MTDKKSIRGQISGDQKAVQGFSYKQLVETALEGIWVFDEKAQTTYVNERLGQLLGYSPEEMIQKPFSHFLFKEDLEDHNQRMAQRRSGVQEVYERRLKRKDGTAIWMSISTRPIFGENGKFAGSFAHLTDITENKRRDKSVQIVAQTQAELACVNEIDQVYILIGSRIQEMIPEGIVGTLSVDENRGVISITHLFGVGQVYADLVEKFKVDPTKIEFPLNKASINELEIFRSGKLRLFEGGISPLFKGKVPKKLCKIAEKQLKINQIRMMGLVSENKHFGGVVVMSENDLSVYSTAIESIVYQAIQVIKRLRADQDRKLHEERLLTTFEAIEDGYWDWEIPTGRIVVNEKMYTMLGYTPGEFPATYDNFLNLVHVDDREKTRLQIEKAKNDHYPFYEVEFRLRTKSGDYKHIFSRGRLIDDGGSDQAIRMVGTHIDISKRKQLEQDRVIFYETQRNILQVEKLEDLYQLVGNSLARLLPDSYIVLTKFDDHHQVVKMAGFYSHNRKLETLLKQFKLSVSNFDVRIDEIEAEDLKIWRSNSLVKYQRGLYGVISKKIPKAICHSIESSLSINTIYLMGCRWNDLDFGGFVFLLKNELGANKELIETLVNDTAIAIQRILAEEKSRETQSRFRSIFRDSPIGIVTVGLDLKYTSVNIEFCRFCGYDDSELLNMSIRDLIHPDHLEQDTKQIALLLAGKIGVYKTEERYIRKDGEIVWGRVLLIKISDSQGQFLYFLATISDISREMIAEEAIKENQRFLEMVLNTIPNYVFVRDIDGKYRLTNKGFAQAMGSTPEKIIGKTDKDLGDRSKLAEMVNNQDKMILESGKDWINPDLQIYFPVGGTKSVQLVKRPLPNIEHKKPAILGVITDISERKMIESALQESEERYRTLIEKSPAGVMLIQKGKFIFANNSALQLFGFDRQEGLIGESVIRFIHPDSQKELLKRIKQIRRNDPNPAMEITIIRKDGELRETESTSSQVNINGKSTTLVFTQDISARKMAEKEIQKRTDDLTLLKRLNDSVNRGDTLQQSLIYLMEETKKIFSINGISILLLSPDLQFLELQSFYIKPEIIEWIEKRIGIKIPKIRIRLDSESIYQHILTGKKFHIIDDKKRIIKLMSEYTENSLFKKLIPSIFSRLEIHSVFAVPLIANNESVGLLELSSNAPFKQDDINRLELISSDLGSILRRKQAEEALKESEEKFRQIVERSNDIFIRQSFSTFQMEYVSPNAFSLLGYKPDEITALAGSEISNFIHPDDVFKFDGFRRDLLQSWRNGNRNYEVEFRLRDKQGDFKWFFANYSLVLDDADNPKTIMCTLSDVTDRKHNELTLRFRVKLMQMASKLTTDELLQAILDEMEEITDSRFGYYYVLAKDENTIDHHVWSTNMFYPSAKETRNKNSECDFCGNVWRKCLLDRRPLIFNTPESFPPDMKKSKRPFVINRELIIPVIRDTRIVSVLGIGNKSAEYTLNDLTMVSKLADLAWDIVENKKIEAELREREAIFNAFLENSPIYVFFKDKEIRSKQLSRNYEQLLGKPLDQLLNKSMDDLFPSEMAQNMIREDQKILNEGKTVVVDEELNGRFYTTIKFPILIDGSPEFLAGFTIDNTDRILSERKLVESEEMYRLISSVVSDYLFSTRLTENNHLDLQWVAGAFEAMTGYTLPEYKAIGGWRGALYPGDKDIDDRDMQNLLQNKKVITEIRTIKKDGSIVWVRVYSQPIWDEKNKRLIGINGAVQDITERKRAEEEIQKSAVEFEALYETAKDFSMHRDPYVILGTITDRACSLFCATNAFVYLYNPESNDLELKFNKTISNALGLRLKMGEGISGMVGEKLTLLILNDYQTWPGKLSEFENSDIAAIMCVPMLYGGQLIGVLGVHENHPSEITFSDDDAHFLSLFASQAAAALYSADLFEKLRLNANELEKRVDERTRELRTKNKELETFTYTVSHDLKAPLRGISGYSSLLMEDYAEKLDAEGKRYLQNLTSSTERMTLLIEDLLSYSRVERREIKKNKVNLNELLDKIVNEYQTEINSSSLRFKIELECGTLITDYDALSQALRNLIDNAVKFTRDCKPPEIIIRSDKLENSCLFSIQDNGIGFDMKYYDKIFEIFQRLHLAEEYPGTGVGLAVVRKAVERLGGKIWAVSEPGSGSTFFMEFPL